MPNEEQVDEILKFWLRKGIVSQSLELPQCNSCGVRYSVERLDLEKTIYCPGCGNPIQLTSKVEVGYKLNPLFQRGLKEGIIPVALTGRFLRRLTQQSFMWVPGIKGKYAGKNIDIDIAAFCDGHLILAECKTEVHETMRDFKETTDKFTGLINFANKCCAEVVLLSSFTENYPATLVSLCKDNISSDIYIELLNGQDLEAGRRTIEKDFAGEKNRKMTMDLDDLLPKRKWKPLQWDRIKGSRRIGL